MAIVTFPAAFRVAGARFERRVAKAATVSPFTFKRQTVLYAGALWRAVLPLTAHRPAEADAIDTFLDLLLTEENTVQFSAADYNRATGPATVSWTLDPESVTALPRRAGGFSDPATVIFRQVI